MRLLVVAIALAPACYAPQLPTCSVHCADNTPCPGDLTCGQDKFCHAAGDMTDCSTHPFSLQVKFAGNGAGTVSVVNGMSCNADCTMPVKQGTQLSLVATPAGAPNVSSFATWGDACLSSGASPTCMLTATTDLTTTAEFHLAEELSVSFQLGGVGPSGTVMFDVALDACTNSCNRFPDRSATVTLTATTNNPQFTFDSPQCPQPTAACTVTMNGPVVVNAIFP